MVTGHFHYGRQLYSDVVELFSFVFCRLVTRQKHFSRERLHWMLVLQVDTYTRGEPTDVTISLACIVQTSENRMFMVDVSTSVDISNLKY